MPKTIGRIKIGNEKVLIPIIVIITPVNSTDTDTGYVCFVEGDDFTAQIFINYKSWLKIYIISWEANVKISVIVDVAHTEMAGLAEGAIDACLP